VFKQALDDLLLLGNVYLILSLLFLERGNEFIDLLLLLIEDLVLLLVAISILLLIHVGCDLFDVSLVGVDDLSRFGVFLLELLDLLVLRLDAVHESLTSFGEGQVHFIGLELKGVLAFGQVVLLFTQVLGALLESVLLQTSFGLHESATDFFKLTAVFVDLTLELLVVSLQLLIIIALLRIEVVKLRFIGIVNILNLLLITL